MKRLVLAVAALGAAASLAACSQKDTATETVAAPAAAPAAASAAPASDMGNMAMANGEKVAKGTGTVTAVDAVAGAITLDHTPIPEANWPAMTMAFKAAPDVAKQVKVGDKVAFDVKVKDGAGEITAVAKQ